MALNKLKFNSINVTPAANEALKFNSSANGFETGSAGGAMTFISKQTASSSATISFTSGIDSTYKEYLFIYNDIHPATDRAHFQFQVDTGTNTNYNQNITNTFFVSYNQEDSGVTGITYDTNYDQGSDSDNYFQHIAKEVNGDNDGCASGILHLFNPSSTTFVKHFMSRSQVYVAPSSGTDFSQDMNFAGYFNTTTALTRVQFKMSTGNIDAGTITLYGIN